MNRSDLTKKSHNISNLPTLPVVVMELNKLLQDYESPMERLLDLLEKDQSLVLKILRLVNSSFFGFKNKVSSLRHAVTLLGYSGIQSAVVAVIDTLSMKKKLKGFEIDRFWEHSIHVAVLSKYLAANTRIAPAENAFTAGLLHDIGKVIPAIFFKDVCHGIGLGLVMALNIIKTYNGSISCERYPGIRNSIINIIPLTHETMADLTKESTLISQD